MNFFEHQDQARKKTNALIALLAAAVVMLIVVTIFVIGVFLYFLQSHSTSVNAYNSLQTSIVDHFWQLIQSPVSLWVGAGVTAFVAIGCLFRLAQLSQGGKVVAESLGGRLIDPGSQDAHERKVINVIEEMAIASGNPVPPVYVIEDDCINAFAAGLNRRDAVVGVTLGCIKLLNRDELQGVIAHEFSHIHNGDMRLNMRLVALLHGILLIGLIGYYLVHSGGFRVSLGTYRRRRQSGKLALLGIALVIIGYGGTFFGNIIKAAVSRQREYLADASAVQFTRNPSGISGALQKIGGYTKGSLISGGSAAEFSHMYFGQGVKTVFNNLMATHPPAAERIKRIEPRWHGSFPSVSESSLAGMGSSADSTSPISHFSQNTTSSASGVKADEINESILEIVGEANTASIQKANELIAGTPALLYEAAHQTFSARAVVYGLLLDSNDSIRKKQISRLKNSAHPATYRELKRILHKLDRLPREAYLTLLNLCIPSLKQQSQPQYAVFKKNLNVLIKADEKVTLFEWSLYRITVRNIEVRTVRETLSLSLSQLKDEIHVLLLALAIAGQNQDALKAFNQGCKKLGMKRLDSLPNNQMTLPELDRALGKLERLKPLEKPRILKAMIGVINSDERVTIHEKELFRAVADTLNCPVPPLD